LIRGRGNGYLRGASPLFDSPLVSLSLKGEEEEILERDFASLLPTLSSLNKGRGAGRQVAKQYP